MASEDGIITECLLPSPPEKIEITKVNHDSVELKWNPSKSGTEDIVTYEIEYQTDLEEDDDTIKNIIATGESTELLLHDLSPDTAYQFRCRAVVPSGVSAFCDLSLPVVTLPSSPPILKKVSQVGHKTVLLEFEEPALKADNIIIKGYNIFYKSCYSSSWEGPIEVGSDEGKQKNIDVEVNETYVFKICAVYDTEHQQSSQEESQDSKISSSIYVVKDLKDLLLTTIFREGLEKASTRLNTVESESDFIPCCQQNLQGLWEHAKYVPEFWRQLLQQDIFSNFFKLIIDNKEVFDDNDKYFIKLTLRQLLNIADDVEFSYCSDLSNWVKEQGISSENHKNALIDLDKISNDLVISDEFLLNCKSFLEEVLDHARYVPDYWKTILVQGKFTTFFSKLIDCQESLEGKPFIQLILRQLIEIAEDTIFDYRENLIKISAEQEINSTDIEEYIAEDLPSFILLMNEILIPQLENKLDILIPETINLINNLLTYLPKSEYIYQRYQCCILEALLMKHDIFSANFDESSSIDVIRVLMDEMKDSWNLFQDYVDKGQMETQAMIFVKFINSVEFCKEDVSVSHTESEILSVKETRPEEEEFNKQVRIIGDDLTIEILQIIDKWANISPFNWKELKNGFQSLEKGDKSILIMEKYIIEEIETMEITDIYENNESMENTIGYENCDDSESLGELNDFEYFNNLLQMLGLTDFFPSKITLWDITKIEEKKENDDGQLKT
ncbi:unnamed protein product, partial [Meganyctiphanes norvegica]